QGVNLGADINLTPGSSKKSGSGKQLAKPGSDSDVRLVGEGSDVSFNVPADSDVKMVQEGPKSGPKSGKAGPKSPRPKQAAPDQTLPEPADSGVRLVPLDSDSDVRIVGADTEKVVIDDKPSKGKTDSDIRLEGQVPAAPGSDAEGMLTEEINLDVELKTDE